MGDIAQNGDFEPFDRAEIFAHRQHIQKRLRGVFVHAVQKRLRGVFVHAVARVDDVRLHRLCKERGRAAHGVTDDDDIVLHRVQRLARVDKRLPLLDGRGVRRNVDDVRAHILGGELEAAARARVRVEFS